MICSYRGSRWCSSAACSPLWWSERGDCQCRSRWSNHAPQCPGSPAASSSPRCCWRAAGRGGSWAGLVLEILGWEKTSSVPEKQPTDWFWFKSVNWGVFLPSRSLSNVSDVVHSVAGPVPFTVMAETRKAYSVPRSRPEEATRNSSDSKHDNLNSAESQAAIKLYKTWFYLII